MFKTVERLLAPKRLGDITGARLSKLAGLLRAEGKSEFTIKNYLAHFRASLQWAVKYPDSGRGPRVPRPAPGQGAKDDEGPAHFRAGVQGHA